MLHLAVLAGTQAGGPQGGPSTMPTAVGGSDPLIFSLTDAALSAQSHTLWEKRSKEGENSDSSSHKFSLGNLPRESYSLPLFWQWAISSWNSVSGLIPCQRASHSPGALCDMHVKPQWWLRPRCGRWSWCWRSNNSKVPNLYIRLGRLSFLSRRIMVFIVDSGAWQHRE